MTKLNGEFNVERHFDKSLSEKYDRRIRMFCPSYDALHRMILPWFQGLPKDALFLSSGAGTGAEIMSLGKMFPSWRFVAVDSSSNMINACQDNAAEARLNERVTFFNGRLQDCKLSTPCDAASSIFVSHFIKCREGKLSYFRSISANLKIGGVLVFADLFGDKTSPEFATLMDVWLRSYALHGVSDEELIRDRNHVYSDVDFITEKELILMLAEAGFATPIRFYQTYLFGGWVTTRVV
ncbi:class I SAM-dependent methyltransferase [Desulfovibrio sulfodismutans]|uniref:Class I SAM-dependent methyltransferase n=1 Tax=Desulfolutivibrio sulfodismutans TaxID=63561 RepID=A0A7K3NNP6_9BACT|nr:class I SAM-dependent methyltransferase [Desulfolutivibrio sulfodismutans]NDY57818.1 class I SAM-dependent methyltransferase [Desulfolutivibrio sulfodismutans]QLA11936.1 methyltransferase domain-containing protein [Desulfolutivibrio sulfodismutans DSM 3696]